MKAIRVHAPGGPEALELEDVPEPTPGTGEALVALEAVGVNFIDVYFRTGLYKAPMPLTLGLEGAGRVLAIGPGVQDVAVGDRVAWTGVPGAYAEQATVPANRLVKVPDGLSARDGAAAMLQGMTAHYLAVSTFPLAAGHTCLIHAAAGGVGLLLCQVARLRGATVIGTVSNEAKAALARDAGAHHVILYSKDDVVTETRRITGGAGVDVVYDGVGVSTFEKSLDSLKPRGLMVSYGQASGPIPPVDLAILNQKGSLYVTRPGLMSYIASDAELHQRAADVLAWVRDGKLKLRIEHVYPLAEAAQAHRDLEGRRTTGKLMLIPG
jgi:NADPH2:quinone reductase